MSTRIGDAARGLALGTVASATLIGFGLVGGAFEAHPTPTVRFASTATSTPASWPSSTLRVSPFRHFGPAWYPVSPSLADSLAESGYPNADDRRWESCAVHVAPRKIRLVCPDGWSTQFRAYADEIGQFYPTGR